MHNRYQQYGQHGSGGNRYGGGPSQNGNASPFGQMSDRDEEKKMLPCRFFGNGFCHRGNRCRFYHPVNANLGTSFCVPPLPQGK